MAEIQQDRALEMWSIFHLMMWTFTLQPQMVDETGSHKNNSWNLREKVRFLQVFDKLLIAVIHVCYVKAAW